MIWITPTEKDTDNTASAVEAGELNNELNHNHELFSQPPSS